MRTGKSRNVAFLEGMGIPCAVVLNWGSLRSTGLTRGAWRVARASNSEPCVAGAPPIRDSIVISSWLVLVIEEPNYLKEIPIPAQIYSGNERPSSICRFV